MEASVETKKALVAYVPAEVTTAQIEAAIEELGFGCELESELDPVPPGDDLDAKGQ